MITLFLSAFWFLAPAMVSNMMPVWVSKAPGLKKMNHPLDHGKTYKGRPVFGKNKTYRGLIAGTLTAALIGLLQYQLSTEYEVIREWELLSNLTRANYIILGGLLGFGALAGDALESFVKRQLELAPGATWFPYDQLDYVFGALLMALPMGVLNPFEYLAVIIVGFVLHPMATIVGYKLGLKDKPI